MPPRSNCANPATAVEKTTSRFTADDVLPERSGMGSLISFDYFSPGSL